MKLNIKTVVKTLLIFTSLALAVNVKNLDASISIYPRVPSEGITISQNGSVGIKNINPQTDLDVHGTISANFYLGNGSLLSGIMTAPSTNVVTNNYFSGVVVNGSVTANKLGVEGTNGAAAGIYLNSATPGAVNSTLYNDSGTLFWNGSALAVGSSVSGTTGYVPKFTAASALGDSSIFVSNNGSVGLGTTNATEALVVSGNGLFSGTVSANFFLGNGSLLTGIMTEPSLNVVTSNYSRGVSINGTISANNFVGSGQGLTNIFSTTSNIAISMDARGLMGAIQVATDNSVISIGSNGNVGIGTSNPIAKLAIGTGNIWINSDNYLLSKLGSGTERLIGASNGNVYVASNGMANAWSMGANDTSQNGKIYTSGSYGNISFAVALNGSDRLKVNPSGNVGIGTILPGANLHVSGNVSGLPVFQVGNATATNSLVVSNNGYVGIGTASPAYPLDVNGTLRAGNGTWTMTATALNSVGGISIREDIRNMSVFNTGALVGQDFFTAQQANSGLGAMANINLQTRDSSNNWLNSRIAGVLLNNVAATRASGLAFLTTDQGGVSTSEKMRIGANGYVGIATDNPTQALSVSGNGFFTGAVNAMTFVGDGAGLTNIFSTTANLALTANIAISMDARGLMGAITAATANNVIFISNSGNVGIGTSNPTYSLDVATGSIMSRGKINEASTDKGVQIGYGPQGDSPRFWLGNGNVATNWQIDNLGGVMRFFTQSNTVMQLYASPKMLSVAGNVGIGVATPLATLHVSGNQTGIPIMLVENASVPNAVVVSNNGYMGIGFANPAYPLDINGSARAVGVFRVGNGVEGTPALSFYNSISTGIYSPTNQTIGFSTYGSERMRISVSGNVGIGSYSPSANLEVSGNTLGQPILKVGNASAPNSLIVSNNGYVGIGTASPLYPLHVAGNVQLDSISLLYGSYINQYGVYFNQSTSGSDHTSAFRLNQSKSPTGSTDNYGINLDITDSSASTGGLGLILANMSGSGTGTGTKFLMDLQRGGDSKFYVQASGNVGIGTTNPVDKLQVIGTINATSFKGDGSGLTNIFSSTANLALTSNIAVSMNSMGLTGAINVLTANQTIIISANGYIGVATVNPQTPFDVGGTLFVVPTINFVGVGGYLQPAEPTTRNLLYLGDNVDLRFSDSTTHRIVFKDPAGAFEYDSTRIYDDNLGALLFNVPIGQTYTFYTNGGNGGDSVVIGPTKVSLNKKNFQVGDTTLFADYIAGRVGVGTNTPLASLHVSANAAGDPIIQIGNSTAPSAFTVSTNGFVGIGTNSPNYPLELKTNASGVVAFFRGPNNSNIQLTQSSTSSGIGGYYGASASDFAVFGGPYSLSSMGITSAGNVSLTPQKDKNIVLIPSGVGVTFISGNVGIGTLTPSANLEISGNVVDQPILKVGNASVSNALVVSTNGYVGLGTANPTDVLQVIGTINATSFKGDASGLTNIYSSTANLSLTANIAISMDARGLMGAIQVATVNPVITITASGNVGIGTSNPLSTFVVSGAGSNYLSYNGASNLSLFYPGNSYTAVVAANSGSSIYLAAESGGYAKIHTGYQDDLYIGANTGTAIYIPYDSSRVIIPSRLGVGTYTPSANLEISGNIAGQPILKVGNASAPNSLIVSTNGYVGIGTASPFARLDLGDTSANITSLKMINSNVSGVNPVMQIISTTNDNGLVRKALDISIKHPATAVAGGSTYALYASGGASGGSAVTDYGVYGEAEEYGVFGTGGSAGIYGLGGTGVAGYFQTDTYTANPNGSGIYVTAGNITTPVLVGLNQAGSAYSGTMLKGTMANGSGTFTGNFVDFQKNAATKFIINHNGNVGVGTSNVSQALVVSGNGLFLGVITANTLAGAGTGLTGTAANLTVNTANVALDVSTPPTFNTGSATLTIMDKIVFSDATAGDISLTLPSVASMSGRVIRIVKIDTSINVISMAGDANIAGETSYVLRRQFGSVTLLSSGSIWVVIGAE